MKTIKRRSFNLVAVVVIFFATCINLFAQQVDSSEAKPLIDSTTVTTMSDSTGLKSLSSESDGDLQVTLQNVIPPSPTAAGLGKFGATPVSMHTGSPEINIPIWEAKGRNLSVPISLSYNATGVKVDEQPGWIGTSWSLNAGGVIAREMHGKPDESSSGFLCKRNEINSLRPLNNETFKEFLRTLADGFYDTEPDVFAFNFNGYSGKFTFSNENDGVNIFPHQNIIVLKDISGDDIVGFTMITPDGARYIFGGADATETTIYHCSNASQNRTYNSSWYLKSILSPDQTENIIFDYHAHRLVYNTESESSQLYISGDNNCGHAPGYCKTTTSLSTTEINPCLKLSRITTELYEVDFIISDMEDNWLVEAKKLDAVKVYRKGNPIREREFVLEYTKHNHGHFLTSVQELTFTDSKPPYTIEYKNADLLPRRDSKKQDHWGYFNNNTASTLIPAETYSIDFPGANRNPDKNKMSYGMISKITFPTGGYDEFIFEPHEVKNNQTLYNTIECSKTIGAIGCDGCEWPDEGKPVANNDNIRQMWFNAEGGGTARITYDVSYGTDGGIHGGNCMSYASIFDDSMVDENGPYEIEFNGTYSSTMELELQPNQDYRIKAAAFCEADAQTLLTVEWSYTSVQPIYNMIGGGVRIKQINTFDGENFMSRRYDYRDPNHPEKSSGKLAGVPNYSYTYIQKGLEYSSNGQNNAPEEYECNYLNRSSNSNMSLGSFNGSHVGYEYVTEYQGTSGENGKIQNKYTLILDSYQAGDVFAPPISFQSQTGKLLESITFRKDPVTSQYVKVTKTSNSYNQHYYQGESTVGLKAIRTASGETSSQSEYNYAYYYIHPIISYMSNSKTTMYQDNSSTEYTDNTDYEYNLNTMQVTKTIEKNSDGSENITLFKHCADFEFQNCVDQRENEKQNFYDALEECHDQLVSCDNDYYNVYIDMQSTCYGEGLLPSLLAREEFINENCYIANTLIIECIDAWIGRPFLYKATPSHLRLKNIWATYFDCMGVEDPGDNICEDQYITCSASAKNVFPYEGNYLYCVQQENSVSTAAVKIILNMQNRNILTPLIEKLVFRKGADGVLSLLNGQFTEYKTYYPYPFQTFIKPTKTYVLETETPIPVTSLSEVQASFVGGDLFKHPNYKVQLEIDQYDKVGNPLTYHKMNDVPISYFWSYNSCLPVAMVNNAIVTQNALGGSASYLGFESNIADDNNPDNDYWALSAKEIIKPTKAHSGEYCLINPEGSQFGCARWFQPTPDYQNKKYVFSAWVNTNQNSNGRLVAGITDSNGQPLPANGYNITYFSSPLFGNTQSEWKYTELIIDLKQIRVASGAPANELLKTNLQVYDPQGNQMLIDDIRFHPYDAQMVSLTYDPVYGQTSKTDANNYSAFYEYDSFGRLKGALDDDHNVKGLYEYHYSDQFSQDPYLVVAPTSISLPYEGGFGNISIASNRTWTASDNASWLEIAPVSGLGNGSITVSCNPAQPGTTPTSSVVTITDGTNTRTITVNRNDPAFLNAPGEIVFPNDGGTEICAISSNTDWTITSSVSWINGFPAFGQNSASFYLVCAADEGSGMTIDHGTLTISGTFGQEVINIVRQKSYMINPTVTGHIADINGNPLAGVTVNSNSAGDIDYYATTGTGGNYSVEYIGGPPALTVSPVKTGYTFVPAHWVQTGDQITGDNYTGINFTALVESQLAISPLAYNFGQTNIGTVGTLQTFIVTNSGSGTATGSISIIGADQSQFGIVSGGGNFSISPGSTRTVAVRFIPVSVGLKTAQLLIAANADGGSALANLSGTGYSFDFKLTKLGLDHYDCFGSNKEFEARVKQNEGTAPFTYKWYLNGILAETVSNTSQRVRTHTFEFILPGTYVVKCTVESNGSIMEHEKVLNLTVQCELPFD